MKTLFLILCSALIFLMFTACANQGNNTERTVEGIKNAGFYIYSFSSQYESQNTWKKVIKLTSFTDQCHGFFSNDTWNPIYINYIDASSNSFEIRISPQDEIWDSSKTTTEIPLNTNWIPDHKGEYYSMQNGGTAIKAKDSFGMDIIITSFLKSSVLADFIAHLEYYGADPATVSNPWKSACGK
jgi:hypothetical protein